MRIFGSERIASLMDKLGMEEGTPIEHRMVSKAIEGAQKKVEIHNFDIRKHLLEYDDVMNQQRKVIYGQRKQILHGEKLTDIIFDMTEDVIDEILPVFCSKDIYPEEWDLKGLRESLARQFSLKEASVAKRYKSVFFVSITCNYITYYRRAFMAETARRSARSFSGWPLWPRIQRHSMSCSCDNRSSSRHSS